MIRPIATVLTAAAIGACTAEAPALVMTDLEVTPPLPGSATSAGYFRLTNNSDETIELSRVASPEYESVEMHETAVEEGIARMRKLTGMTVGPYETIVFERGGRHLMLVQPVGDVETVTLSFYSEESLLLTASTRIGRDN